ncbi:DUF1748 domain-containing protein, partial [Ascoidea rubescens DSM 1968]
MAFLGKALHYSIDLVLISTCLAGIKRTTGLTPKLDLVENKEIREYSQKYLNVGESVLDSSVGIMSSSSYFVR